MVHLQLDLSHPQTHQVGVVLRFRPHQSRQRLRLPAWTPGSYLIRDYVRLLEGLSAEQLGRPVPLKRLEPACWQLDLVPGEEVVVRYSLTATELTVRTPHIDQDHAFLPMAAVALEVEGQRWNGHGISCLLPPGWKAFVPLPAIEHGWRAADFDQLIDAPLEFGPHQEQTFSVAAVPHRWVTWDAGVPPGQQDWLNQRFPSLLRDVEQVCLACCALMGVERPPCGNYLFVLHLLDEGYGGLEHDNSCVLVFSRRTLEQPQGYRKLLQLIAHEYLHQWNVRRLRPRELAPIDYHQPVIIPTLWFAEGVTSYVDQLLPFAAGLCSREQVLEDLGSDLSRYLLTPGRAVQSLRESSQEAWVKLYRADAHSPDSQVSYYLKGAVVALCLDLHLRRHGSSLALVLRDLWGSHGCWRRGYSEQDLLSAFSRFTPDLEQLLPEWLQGHQDPDLDGYLAGVGLQLEPEMSPSPWAGFTCRAEPVGLIVQRVVRHGPAQRAGLMVGDELIGLDGERLRHLDQLPARLSSPAPHQPGQNLLISRRSQLRSLELRSCEPRPERFRLAPLPQASAACLEAQQRWLRLSEPPW